MLYDNHYLFIICLVNLNRNFGRKSSTPSACVRVCVFSDLIYDSQQQKHGKLKSAIVREEKNDDGKDEVFLGSVKKKTAVMFLLTKL